MKAIINILNQLQNILADNKSSSCEICYRGVSDKSWKDEPALFRNNNLENETRVLNEIIRQFPDDFIYSHTIDILNQLQHYSCPTRMMDVTTNFLVALFFACGGWEQVLNPQGFEKLKQIDGKITIYSVPNDNIKSVDSETAIVISNIARIEGNVPFKKYVWKCVKDQGGAWDDNNEDLIKSNIQDLNKVILVKTKLNNPRVRAQFGEFFLFGGIEGISYLGNANLSTIMDQKVSKKPIPFPQEYIQGNIYIPSSEKELVLSDLRQYFGISFATLCPEKHDVVQTLMKY